MQWNGTSGFAFNRQSVLANAPDASGVYGLFNQGIWLYFGEAQNIRERLLQHITDSHSPLIKAANPQWFAYELVQPILRVPRQNQLISLYCPQCNQRLG
jgi:excinuclease UvrABC nuclease subunit